jgi:hypothetical protein
MIKIGCIKIISGVKEIQIRKLILLLCCMLVSGAITINAGEIMKDRCSQMVAIVPSYYATPDTPGTHLLVRKKNGWSPWTKPFKVKLDSDGYIYWWCHSTTGNWLDPGTWTVHGNPLIVISDRTGAAFVTNAVYSLSDSGWTPERSRCSNHSTRIRARLGPHRLLVIECLGN